MELMNLNKPLQFKCQDLKAFCSLLNQEWKSEFIEAMSNKTFQQVYLYRMYNCYQELYQKTGDVKLRTEYCNRGNNIIRRLNYKYDKYRKFPFLLRNESKELLNEIKSIADQYRNCYSPISISSSNFFVDILRAILEYSGPSIPAKEAQIAFYMIKRYRQDIINNTRKFYPLQTRIEQTKEFARYFDEADNHIAKEELVEMLNQKDKQLEFIVTVFCYYCSLQKVNKRVKSSLFNALQRRNPANIPEPVIVVDNVMAIDIFEEMEENAADPFYNPFYF